jgi:hypothetical protein
MIETDVIALTMSQASKICNEAISEKLWRWLGALLAEVRADTVHTLVLPLSHIIIDEDSDTLDKQALNELIPALRCTGCDTTNGWITYCKFDGVVKPRCPWCRSAAELVERLKKKHGADFERLLTRDEMVSIDMLMTSAPRDVL